MLPGFEAKFDGEDTPDLKADVRQTAEARPQQRRCGLALLLISFVALCSAVSQECYPEKILGDRVIRGVRKFHVEWWNPPDAKLETPERTWSEREKRGTQAGSSDRDDRSLTPFPLCLLLRSCSGSRRRI